jgi:hypothetical protein
VVTDELSLLLELTEQDRWGFLLLLRIKNTSIHRRFFPNPEITCLRFAPIETLNPLEWYTSMLVSSESGGTTIEPDGQCSYSFRVRPCTIEPKNTQFENDWDYERWCLRLIQGEFHVWAECTVDETYFHPDSHLRFRDLGKMAAENDAALWTGTTRSNILTVYYAEHIKD